MAASPIKGIAGVILAGGASSRFGSNKALADCQGGPLIAKVAKVLESLFSERLLVTNTPATYDFLGWPTTSDRYRDAGPLAGIHAALATIKADRAMVVACDMPNLDARLLRFLCGQGPEWDVVLPRLANGREPLHAVYSKRCLPVIERHLHQGQRKLWQLFADLTVREVGEKELFAVVPSFAAFHNVNRPEDLCAPPTKATAPLSLAAAQSLLRSLAPPTAPEYVALVEAVGRIPAEAVRAPRAVPAFRQSTRDGFAVRSRDARLASAARPVILPIQGEIAAGDTTCHRLVGGKAMRIMTGAPLPQGADAVVPFEEVGDEGDAILLSRSVTPRTHFRPAGADCRAGQILATTGQPITPFDLARLAPAGVAQLPVHRLPRIGFLCTGSELTEDAATLQAGQIVSGNRPLLQALIRQYGGEPVDFGTVPDSAAALCAAFAQAQAQDLNLCITTGGMGPGKYDLVEHALTQLGARFLYQSLKVRPGKATLAAVVNGLLVIALPGPPPAVHLLFHELVAPCIRQALGDRQRLPQVVKATLTSPVTVRQRGVLHLKEAVLSPHNGTLHARLPRQSESANAILLVPLHRKNLPIDDIVALHLLPA